MYAGLGTNGSLRRQGIKIATCGGVSNGLQLFFDEE